MSKSIIKTISNGLFSFYVYYSTLLIGWQLVSFVYLYQSTNSTDILNRQIQWLIFQPFLIGVGATLTILLLITHRISPSISLQQIQGLPKQVMIQNIFLALLFLNYLSFLLGIHLEVFELIAFLTALWVLNRWGSVFYHSNLAAWRHPTTYGSFIISGFLIGVALLSLFLLKGTNTFTVYIILVILLTFDLLIVFARFQYLSKSSESTNRIARKLIGRRILFFGMSIIIGIFMPAVFIIYNILIAGENIKGVEILILLGKLIDRYLFLELAET
jgi:hypothetical protein